MQLKECWSDHWNDGSSNVLNVGLICWVYESEKSCRDEVENAQRKLRFTHVQEEKY